MASPKRKTKSTAKTAQAHATRSAYKPGTAKPAKEDTASAAWAKPAAQLYQLPFNAEEMSEATQKAAANATEMWRTMWDSKNQQWKQFLANAPKLPGFDGNAAEKMNLFSRESNNQFTRSAATAASMLNEAIELARENTEAFTEAGNQTVALSKELGAEIIGYANRTFAQNVELSKEVLTCRTLNDLFDLSSRFLKTNLDGFFTESVELSETLFRSATDISEPLNERLTETTDRLTKAMSA